MQQWAITRNAVKKRARVLGVELIRPDAHTALWPGDALPLGQRYHDHVQAGRLTRDFPELPRSTETTAIAKPATAPGSALVTKQPKPVAAPLAAPEQLAALVAALGPVPPWPYLTPLPALLLLVTGSRAPSLLPCWESPRAPRHIGLMGTAPDLATSWSGGRLLPSQQQRARNGQGRRPFGGGWWR
jgi:hypothetical protein